MITFEKNPYTWDIKRSHYIQPEVFSFSFRDKNGKKIPVDNLAKDIEIQLPNKKENIIHLPLNHSVENDDFLLFNFKVDDDHYEELIMIDIKNPNSEYKKAILYVKFGEKVIIMLQLLFTFISGVQMQFVSHQIQKYKYPFSFLLCGKK